LSKIALAKLKNINRSLHLKLDEQRKELESKKTNVEKLQLNYENLLYKKQHLKREIQICKNLDTPNLDSIEKERKEEITLKHFEENLWETHHPRSMNLLAEEKQLRLTDMDTLKAKEQQCQEYQDTLDKKRKFIDTFPDKLSVIKKYITDLKQEFVTIQPTVMNKVVEEQENGSSDPAGCSRMEEEEEEEMDLIRSRMYDVEEEGKNEEEEGANSSGEAEGEGEGGEGEEGEGMIVEEEGVVVEEEEEEKL
jgi:hypothetical protein